jgi:hypothetical protein
MYKLLLGLGIIDLTFHFPHLTTLTIVGVFLYNNLTDEDKQQLMSIYSNGKEFTKYLTRKARELGLTIKDLRKQVVTDLEIPEAAPDYSQAIEDKSDLEIMLSEYISNEDINRAKDNVILVEQLAKTIKESLEVPESIWIESTLEIFLQKHDFDNDFRNIIEQYLTHLPLTDIFTTKDFRQLQAKVKSLYRNAAGEIIDTDLENVCDSFLTLIKAYFTDNYNYEIN